MKHAAPTKSTNDMDKLLSLALKNYIVGDFYQTRKLVHRTLYSQEINAAQKTRAAELLRLTSIDKLALSAGFISVLLTTLTAFLVGY